MSDEEVRLLIPQELLEAIYELATEFQISIEEMVIRLLRDGIVSSARPPA
jgi:hypothetical protein